MLFLNIILHLPEMGRLEIINITPIVANTIMPIKRTYIEFCMIIAAYQIDILPIL